MFPGASGVTIDIAREPAAWSWTYVAPGYVRRIAGRVLLQPVLVRGEQLPNTTLSKRQTPLDLEHQSVVERTTIQLPAGVRVEKLPPAVRIQSDFGEYTLAFESPVSGRVIVQRSLTLRRSTIPPDAYEQARAFARSVRAAESTGLVLVAGNP